MWREKYSEEKLQAQANFFKVSPTFLTAAPDSASNGTYVSTAQLATTHLTSTDHPTNFYIIRLSDFTSRDNTSYQLEVSTSKGNVSLPQLGGQLTLSGKDAKIHVTDYDVQGINIVYCTAEIYTWAKDKTVKRALILYGDLGELHELEVDLRCS